MHFIKVINKFDGERMHCSIDSVKQMKSSFQMLLTEIERIQIMDTLNGNTYPGGYFLELLEKSNVSYYVIRTHKTNYINKIK